MLTVTIYIIHPIHGGRRNRIEVEINERKMDEREMDGIVTAKRYRQALSHLLFSLISTLITDAMGKAVKIFEYLFIVLSFSLYR